jgi:hypothetical protein
MGVEPRRLYLCATVTAIRTRQRDGHRWIVIPVRTTGSLVGREGRSYISKIVRRIMMIKLSWPGTFQAEQEIK